MNILVKQVPGLTVPKRAHNDDASYDIFATSEPNIVGVKFERVVDGISAWSKIDYVEYKTSLFMAPQDSFIDNAGIFEREEYHILIFPRSSNCKKNLLLANSVATIDRSYRGEILIRFKYVFQPEDLIILPEAGRQRLYGILNPETVFQKGDRIAQMQVHPNREINFQLVEDLDNTKRGTGGFGSTN